MNTNNVQGISGSLQDWERAHLDPVECRRREINARIEDLQERSALTRGEEIELNILLKEKWSPKCEQISK